MKSTFLSWTVFGLMLMTMCLSCHRFFMPVKSKTSTSNETASFLAGGQGKKYFILRQNQLSYSMQDISVNKENYTLSCKLDAVPQEHLLYLAAKKNNYKYKGGRNEAPVLNEVHVYIKNSVTLDNSKPLVLPLDQIEKIEVIEHDGGRTTSSYILGGIGVGIGTIALVGIIIALTKSSCPYVSVFDGEQYQLQGELFGGAVNHQLERTDYVPLQIQPVNNTYRIRISNELKERQYTNFAYLRIIEHSRQTKALIDANGSIVTIANAFAPKEAWLNDNTIITSNLQQQDDVTCNFNDTSAAGGINRVRMVFDKQPNASSANLVLRLKNSYWLDYLYGEFARRFGSNYVKWQEKQQTKSAASMIRWTEEQQIPLTISIKTANGWQPVSKIKTTGPLLNRNMVVSIDLSKINGNQLEFQLSSGFMFWELDYAAIDFSESQFKEVALLKPVDAVDEKGASFTSALSSDDGLYLNQPEPGNIATLTYELKQQPKEGNVFSVFLVTKGYYEPVREFTGRPDMSFLKNFRKQGEMSRFSRSNYLQYVNEKNRISSNVVKQKP